VTALARLFAALLVAAVLADASACATAPLVAERGDGVVRMSQLCTCGCHAHTGAPAGIGLTQLAALPAESLVPNAPRIEPAQAPVSVPRAAPRRPIDHVPIPLA
jgi:hypothetical protein